MSVKAWALVLLGAAIVLILFASLTPKADPVDECLDKADLSTQGISREEWNDRYDRALAECEATS
jgi:hypothetical protein